MISELLPLKNEAIDEARSSETLKDRMVELQSRMEDAHNSGDMENARYCQFQIDRLKSDLARTGDTGQENSASANNETYMAVSYESLNHETGVHYEKERAYRSQANKLEDDIRHGRADSGKASEVKRLNEMANQEHRKAEQSKQMAQQAMMESVNFRGGMGVTEIKHVEGASMVSKARSLESSAAMLESDARRAENAGQISKAAELRAQARAKRNEAKSLRAKGEKLMNA